MKKYKHPVPPLHLEISQTDSYQVTITGSNTKGSIHLKV